MPDDVEMGTHLHGLGFMSRVGDEGRELETGRWCSLKVLVKGKRSPLEKGVLSTKKEERKNELKWIEGKKGNQGRSTPCELCVARRII